MEPRAYVDTSVALWLYLGETARLSPPMLDLVDVAELRIPSMTILELGYLHEIGRVVPTAGEVIARLVGVHRFSICDLPFVAVAQAALDIHWTRDPFDRLIVANAIAASWPLITPDETIRAHFADAIW